MGRAFGFISILVVLAAGMYIYMTQFKQATAVGGTTSPTGAVNITGVRSDLLSIASAERTYYASQGKYATLDELISGNYVTVKGERPPFTYSVEPTSTGFRAVATRSGEGSPSQISIDETMQVQTTD
jgi:hypothetical protein